MCLIIYKKSGLPLPAQSLLDNAFKNNPDGFGVAFYEVGESHVHIKKGAMTIDEMHKLLAEIDRPWQKVMMLHFRQATAGKVTPANTHPYPFSNKDEDLAALDITTKVAIAHNGIIFGEYEYKGVTNMGYTAKPSAPQTDTALFIKNELFGMGKAIFNRKVASLIGGHTNSKFIFFSPNSVMTVGEFIKEDGILYSNRSFAWAVVTNTFTPQKPFLAWNKTAIGKAWIRSGGKFSCPTCEKDCWAIYDLDGYEVCRDCFVLLNEMSMNPYVDDKLTSATQTDDSDEEDEGDWTKYGKLNYDKNKWEVSASGQLVRKVLRHKETKDIESHVDKMDKGIQKYKDKGREELQHSLMTLPPETP